MRFETRTFDLRLLRFESLERRILLAGQTVADLSAAEPADVVVSSDDIEVPEATSGPTGLTPAQLRQAYGVNQITFDGGSIVGNGAGMTIAIVEA